MVVDSFAGGGGASSGIVAALGRPIDLAINHDPEAIAMHAANHPETRHALESVWKVDPREACGGRPVGLAWFSPDCTHFSRAKGTKPVKKEIRGLAWVVTRWARTVRPRVIMVENVEEFTTWGPLGPDSRPDPAKMGRYFRAWIGQLSDLGYQIEFRTLVAADYGAPTIRKRLYLIARRDRAPIAWPEPTHGKGRAEPWRAAAEIIDWSLPCPSIFERSRPLAEATLRRIATGIQRYVVDAAEPFIVPYGDVRAPVLIKHYGGVVGHGVERPIGTVTARDHHSLACAFLTKFYGSARAGAQMTLPMPTITAGGNRGGGHIAEVRAFLIQYYSAGGRDQTRQLGLPLGTVTTHDRFGLVMVRGEPYQIADIGMRMLSPPELFAAQDFPADYRLDVECNGKPLTKTALTRLAGNAVCRSVPRALVTANA